jgi:hypothetical protein
MNAKKVLLVAALFVVFSVQHSFGQVGCFMDVSFSNVAWDSNNCPIAAVSSTGYTSIQFTLDPNPFQWPGQGGSMMVSGTLAGDLGAAKSATLT